MINKVCQTWPHTDVLVNHMFSLLSKQDKDIKVKEFRKTLNAR